MKVVAQKSIKVLVGSVHLFYDICSQEVEDEHGGLGPRAKSDA